MAQVADIVTLIANHMQCQDKHVSQIISQVTGFPQEELTQNVKSLHYFLLQQLSCFVNGNKTFLQTVGILARCPSNNINVLPQTYPSNLQASAQENDRELKLLEKAVESGPVHAIFNKQTDTSRINIMIDTRPSPQTHQSSGSNSPDLVFSPTLPHSSNNTIENSTFYPLEQPNRYTLEPFHEQEQAHGSSRQPINHSQSMKEQSQKQQHDPRRRNTEPGIPSKNNHGKNNGATKATPQCLRKAFHVFIHNHLPTPNMWFEFERLGLELSDQDINHINEKHTDAYPRKFCKLQKWSEGRPFANQNAVMEALLAAVEKMNAAASINQ